ncbi:hypothetical protein M422DRAFT_234529 [Sphaerobolus stellatus SS14]|uniref:HNH nuclease domain-containing protein n=1 Tax=Sphaerobolus stellatus (strain SS14) TaxID=990650 RepID=A0A0C9UAE8_SPHS4|nr:hypothetical protein M422DRAFT_234529 [Sphaerobolus stellatus SS14]
MPPEGPIPRPTLAPERHVHLVLFTDRSSTLLEFYLEIPIVMITSHCLWPVKYLRYLGWSILGVEGVVRDKATGNEMGPNDTLTDRAVYSYVTASDAAHALQHAVDLEVIKKQTTYASSADSTRDRFKDSLEERDGVCIFTDDIDAQACHIIPFARGDAWLQLILANRPNFRGVIEAGLENVNDARNGFFASPNIHNSFDRCNTAILKTPNLMLAMNDIPATHQRLVVPNMAYPTTERYTFQWLNAERMAYPPALLYQPDNNDAKFRTPSAGVKPSPLLLHYRYGATAVKQWGKNTMVLNNHPGLRRPPKPETLPLGPSRTRHDHGSVPARRQAEAERLAKLQGAGSSGLQESAMEEPFDEHDVMLFFWGNTPAARERRAQSEKDRKEYIERWQASTAVN